MSNKLIWAGRILSGLIGSMMITIAFGLIFVRSAEVLDGMARFGYTESAIRPIGWVTVMGAMLYLIPRTAVLGAIVLTGYFGGAVATHVRIGDSFAVPLAVAILLWLGLYLRNGRLRALLRLRG